MVRRQRTNYYVKQCACTFMWYTLLKLYVYLKNRLHFMFILNSYIIIFVIMVAWKLFESLCNLNEVLSALLLQFVISVNANCFTLNNHITLRYENQNMHCSFVWLRLWKYMMNSIKFTPTTCLNSCRRSMTSPGTLSASRNSWTSEGNTNRQYYCIRSEIIIGHRK